MKPETEKKLKQLYYIAVERPVGSSSWTVAHKNGCVVIGMTPKTCLKRANEALDNDPRRHSWERRAAAVYLTEEDDSPPAERPLPGQLGFFLPLDTKGVHAMALEEPEAGYKAGDYKILNPKQPDLVGYLPKANFEAVYASLVHWIHKQKQEGKESQQP